MIRHNSVHCWCLFGRCQWGEPGSWSRLCHQFQHRQPFFHKHEYGRWDNRSLDAGQNQKGSSNLGNNDNYNTVVAYASVWHFMCFLFSWSMVFYVSHVRLQRKASGVPPGQNGHCCPRSPSHPFHNYCHPLVHILCHLHWISSTNLAQQ